MLSTFSLNAEKISTLEKTINNLKEKLPNRPSKVPVPIKLEIPYAKDTPSLQPAEHPFEPITTQPTISNPPISEESAADVKKEATPDPKYNQSHIETEDDESATEEIAPLEVKRKPEPKTYAKRGRPPGPVKSKKDVEINAKRDSPRKNMRRLSEHKAVSAATTSKSTISDEVPVEHLEVIRPSGLENQTPATKKKTLAGPLRSKLSKNAANGPSKERPVIEPASEQIPAVDVPKDSSPIKQSKTDDDNKVNELKNLLTDITKGDAKDPKLLDSFQNILGKDGFAKLKALFVENISSVTGQLTPEPQIVEQQPIEPKKQLSPPAKKPKRSSPLKMPPVSGNQPRGRKRTEVDRLNEDIMDCFIRDGVLKANGLRNVSKVKYDEVVAMEDYEIDDVSCSDSDEPLINRVSNKVRENVQTCERVSVISGPQSSMPATSQEAANEPEPETKPCFIFDKKVELNCDTMEYRLLSGITGNFELCEDLKPTFPGFHNQLQASKLTANVENDEVDRKPLILLNMNHFDFGPREIITIKDDDIPDPQPDVSIDTKSTFEIITIDDDEPDQATTECSVKNAAERVAQVETISIDEDTVGQPDEEDLIYNQYKDFPTLIAASPSKVVQSLEQKVFNLSFFESRRGILMRCRAEKCFYEHIDRHLFQYHVQTRHCLAKWDGSCKLCGSSYSYGSLLDEFNHMESHHISKLKDQLPGLVYFDKPSPITESASPKPPVATASSQAAINHPPVPSQSMLDHYLQSRSNSLVIRPIVNVLTPPTHLPAQAKPASPIAMRPPDSQVTIPSCSTLRLRSLPGDKLSGGSQSSRTGSDGVITSPVQNTVQVSAPTTNQAAPTIVRISAPTTNQFATPTSVIVSTSSIISALEQNLSNRMKANDTFQAAYEKSQSKGIRTYAAARKLRLSVSTVPNTALVPPAVPAISSNTIVQSFPVQPQQRLLRPWLNDNNGKPNHIVDQMLQLDCLRNQFKCMATVCGYHTNDPKEFAVHLLGRHSSVPSVRFEVCAYCSFSARTIAELVSHINTEHDIDTFGCTQCFYRAVAAETVRDHEKMYHPYTGILIKSNHTSVTKISFQEEILAAREGRKKFVPAIICAGEFCAVFPANFSKTSLLLGCSQRFHHFERYRDHLKSRHNSSYTIFRCNKCKEETDFETVHLHLENCHKIMRFHCVQCPTGFGSMNELRKHLIDCHANKLPFFCERSLEKLNSTASQSSPESVVLQFMGVI